MKQDAERASAFDITLDLIHSVNPASMEFPFFLQVFAIIKEKVAEKEKKSTELANGLSVKKTI